MSVETKVCNKCYLEKSLKDFYIRRDRNSFRYSCKVCDKKYREDNKLRNKPLMQKWYQDNKEHCKIKARSNNLLRHGSSIEEKQNKLVSQGNCCAICKTTKPGPVGWHQDHIHNTKIPRGVLCQNCNIGIGNFRDSSDLMIEAIKYLDIYKRPEVSIERDVN